MNISLNEINDEPLENISGENLDTKTEQGMEFDKNFFGMKEK